MLASYHRRHDGTLRVTHQRNIANEAEVLRVGENLLQVLNLVRNGHLGELAVTFAMTVEVKLQCSNTLGVQLISHLH